MSDCTFGAQDLFFNIILDPRPEFSMLVLVDMDVIFGFIGRILLGLLLWVVLLPVTLVIATPFILVLALFESKPYGEAVANGYSSALRLWEKIPLP
jgi:hypothetical protein